MIKKNYAIVKGNKTYLFSTIKSSKIDTSFFSFHYAYTYS